MPDFNTPKKYKSIVSVTFNLLQTSDGARFWEPMSGLDESELTVEDVAKFQYHLLHWHAAMQESLVRYLQKHRCQHEKELARLAAEFKELADKVKQLADQVSPVTDQVNGPEDMTKGTEGQTKD
jgi:uncharacterized coiled-coil protein SlyX